MSGDRTIPKEENNRVDVLRTVLIEVIEQTSGGVWAGAGKQREFCDFNSLKITFQHRACHHILP